MTGKPARVRISQKFSENRSKIAFWAAGAAGHALGLAVEPFPLYQSDERKDKKKKKKKRSSLLAKAKCLSLWMKEYENKFVPT